MKKPMSLQEFANQHKENYALIKEVVNLCQDILHWQHKNLCAVCDKELTDDEIKALLPHHCYFCCDEHAEYREYFLIDPIRKRLGYAERLFINIE